MTRRTDDPTPLESVVIRCTNRMGDIYYLHHGKTKTGKLRYFVAKRIGRGALAAMPEGFEFTESINGVVSVRKVDQSEPRISDIDLAIVRSEMARQQHLRLHRVEVVKTEIVVFEPGGGTSIDDMAEMGRRLGVSPEAIEARLGNIRPRTRYTPVMKFVPSDQPGFYAIHRMTYRGDGGWSNPLASGPLQKIVKQYLGRVGTDAFFELY